MNIDRNGNIKSVGVLISLLLLTISGMAVTAQAQSDLPNFFYGDVTIDCADAPVGTVINAYIGGELRGTITVDTEGEYGHVNDYLGVIGTDGVDDGAEITFTISGNAAQETSTWGPFEDIRELPLSTGDISPPVIVSAAFDNPTPVTGDTITLIVEATDNVGVTSVTADGVSLSMTGGNAQSGTWTVSAFAEEGTHTYTVIASDAEGNTDTESVSYTATPVNEAPVIVSAAFDNPTPVTGDPITLTVEATDDVGVTSVTADGVSLSMTGGNAQSGTWTVSAFAEEGTHTYTVIASDAEGNTDTESVSYTATPVNGAPVIVSAAFDNPTPVTGDPITLTVEATDDVGVTSVTADGVSLSMTGGNAQSGTWTVSAFAEEGTHTFTVIASDAEGNTDTESVSYTATPVNGAPVIVSAAFDNPTPETGDPIILTVEATDDVGVTSVTADGVSLSMTGGNAQSGTWTVSAFAEEGTHTFTVIASDAEGNTDTESVSYTATTTPENEAPVIVSAAFDNTALWIGDIIILTVEATDDVEVTSVTANGEAMTNTGVDTWELEVTAVEGTHIYDIIAYDEEGLFDTDSASYTGPTEIPEFSTIAIPIAAMLGLMFFFSRRKK